MLGTRHCVATEMGKTNKDNDKVSSQTSENDAQQK